MLSYMTIPRQLWGHPTRLAPGAGAPQVPAAVRPGVAAPPGPRGPDPGLVAAIFATKSRNPRWGCARIAQQLALAVGIDLDKDVVRRVLARYRRPGPSGGGPSWLTFLGNARDSLWSVDLFRCESATLRSH